MTDNLPELPEPKRVYTFAGFNEWFTLDQIHSYALTAIASERARADALKTVMIAAAEEIAAHWEAHCDAEGYGPQNLLHRLEEGIPSEYGYTAGAFADLKSRADALEAALSRLVLAIDAVGADDTGSEETLGEWHEARESARSLLEKKT